MKYNEKMRTPSTIIVLKKMGPKKPMVNITRR
jgi:hypothetical protein